MVSFFCEIALEQKIEHIRQKCVEANPNGYEFGVPRSIRLTDVLLALGADKQSHEDATHELLGGYRYSWNLRQDDLTQQSDPTIDFVYDLLKVEV